MGKVVGIDLGTTNSVVAIWEGGKVTVIPNADGLRLTPSVVTFTEKGERIVGIQAKRQSITRPECTVYSIKRFMGRRRSEVTEEEKIVPYKIIGASDELVKVRVYEKEYSPPEISALILQNLRESAEAYLGQKITEAVITVPAYFNDSQRQATKDAGRIAGLDVKRIINEPTASALAYGLDKRINQKVAVYDLGGGTFDISIIEVGDNVVEVLSTNGDTHLGGDDMDQILMHYICDEFRKEQGIDLRKDILALQRLKEACERAKCELSTSTETEINLPFITADASGPKHLQTKLTRAKLESLCEALIKRTVPPLRQALADAKLKPEEINEVILVGGATRMPIVQKLVRDFFGKEPNRSVNPDEAVAIGAAIQAAVLSQELKDILLLDVTPLSLGVETLGGIFTKLIERNTTIPVSKKEIFSTAADNQTSVEVRVYQGEREMAADNRLLGSFVLDGIPPAPRGVPKIEVAFDIDANGILNVSAKDLATGKAQSIIIKASSGLSEQEVQRMVKDSEKFREQDKTRKELADLRNKTDNTIYTTEKLLRDFQDKVSPDDRKKIEEAINEVKKTRDKDDAAEIRRALDALEKATHKVVQQAYETGAKQYGTQQQQTPPSDSNKKDKPDDYIDAEYKEK